MKTFLLWGNGKWDAVVMSEVLEHLYFPDRKMIEIRKLVKPGGSSLALFRTASA